MGARPALAPPSPRDPGSRPAARLSPPSGTAAGRAAGPGPAGPRATWSGPHGAGGAELGPQPLRWGAGRKVALELCARGDLAPGPWPDPRGFTAGPGVSPGASLFKCPCSAGDLGAGRSRGGFALCPPGFLWSVKETGSEVPFQGTVSGSELFAGRTHRRDSVTAPDLSAGEAG